MIHNSNQCLNSPLISSSRRPTITQHSFTLNVTLRILSTSWFWVLWSALQWLLMGLLLSIHGNPNQCLEWLWVVTIHPWKHSIQMNRARVKTPFQSTNNYESFLHIKHNITYTLLITINLGTSSQRTRKRKSKSILEAPLNMLAKRNILI